MNKDKRACVFCGEGNLTLEHVFPNWMSKLFDPKTTVTTKIECVGKVEKSYVSSIFQHKAKIVCSTCNGGWMSDIETSVESTLKPMLFNLDYSTKLNESDQKSLALWAQKTAMIMCQSTGSNYKIPDESYKKMYQSKAPVDQISVRLGWRLPKKGENGPLLSHFRISQISGPIPPEHAESLKGAEAWKAIIAIGSIVFHLSGSTSNIIIELENNDSRVTPQIFPYISNVIWPIEWPVDAMTSAGFEEFMYV